jgi:GntR family transcriptional regulator / MocR family aminotransferase
MDFYLELDGSGALHVQLTRALREAIMAKRLHRDTRLPPTRTLAHELGVSRNTVLAAYEQLRSEGFIVGKVGSGSYVAPVASMRSAPPVPKQVPPPSRYARRMRSMHHVSRKPSSTTLRYNLQYGEPLLNPKLTSTWRRELAHASLYTPPGYPRTRGVPELCQAVCDYLGRRRGVRVNSSQVLIVNGTQQAMALAARVLVDEGDSVVVEDPQYLGAREIMQIHGARLVAVPVDEDGIDCSKLPRAAPRLVIVTPSHQFPIGSVLSLPRRIALLEYAVQKKCWILEDDYDGEFRYDAQPLAALRSLDSQDRVIYVGSFSKVVLPSLRLGYMVVPEALMKDFTIAKWLSDLGSSAIEQVALANFMATGTFERHLRQCARMLKARRSALLVALEEHAGAAIEVVDSDAGMHLAAWLPDYDETRLESLMDLASTRGVGLYSLSPLFLRAPARTGLLLGYAGLSVAEIQAAVRILGTCLRDN